MEPSGTSLPPTSYLGHVENGVVVFDARVPLKDGQAVRVEPLEGLDAERADHIAQLQKLFAEWTQEDGQLAEDEADKLQTALDQSSRVGLRTPALD
jgi:hypothetical protein